MKQLTLFLVLAGAGAFLSGCSSTRKQASVVSTPIEYSGPVTVTGPITVSGFVANPEPVTPVPAPSAMRTRAIAPSAPAPTSPTSVSRPASAANLRQASDGGQDLELKREALSVDRATVSNGAAVIRKVVTSESVTIPVTLTTEDFTVERVSDGGPPSTPWGEDEVVISIPLSRETATPRITTTTERVIVRKTRVAEQKDVTGTIRRETVDVVKQTPQ